MGKGRVVSLFMVCFDRPTDQMLTLFMEGVNLSTFKLVYVAEMLLLG